MMAVEQRRPGIVGDEIDLHGAVPRHVDGVFHDARGRLVAHPGDLEGMAVEVDRMVVAALVGHCETVALSALRAE